MTNTSTRYQVGKAKIGQIQGEKEMSIQVGTSHFVSLEHAAQYYSFYYGNNIDNGRAAAKRKITTGEIHIGPPELKPGETLQIIDDGTRYAIVEIITAENRLQAIKIYCEKVRSDFFDLPEAKTWMTAILILAGFEDRK